MEVTIDGAITEPAASAETEIDASAAAADQAQPDGAADQAADSKAKNREGYEARKSKAEAEALRKELEGYKRREDEARKATLTEQQRVQEERDTLAAENARLKQTAMQQRIAAEFKLPATLATRLIGTDEDSLRADAEDLAKLMPKPKVGTPTDPVRDQGGKRSYKRSELQADPALARSAEVLAAAREGRITND